MAAYINRLDSVQEFGLIHYLINQLGDEWNPHGMKPTDEQREWFMGLSSRLCMLQYLVQLEETVGTLLVREYSPDMCHESFGTSADFMKSSMNTAAKQLAATLPDIALHTHHILTQEEETHAKLAVFVTWYINGQPTSAATIHRILSHIDAVCDSLIPPGMHNTVPFPIDFKMVYHAKLQLLNAASKGEALPTEAVDCIIGTLDWVGDCAESNGLFTYPQLIDEQNGLWDDPYYNQPHLEPERAGE